MRRLLLVVLSLIAITAEARRRPVTPGTWRVPGCSQVTGFPVVSLSVDGGRTVLPHVENAEEFQIYTFGLAALEQPGRLLAVAARLLLRSDDGGCNWTVDSRLQLPQAMSKLEPAPGGVWAWSWLGPELFFIADSGIVARTAPVPLPLAFHAESATRLAVADGEGKIWWSDDAGATWTLRATAPARPPLYALEFASRDHAIATGLADGASVTFDGGLTWTASAGLERQNVFTVAFSPVDRNVAWAIAIDPLKTGADRRAIHRSVDGGRTFTRILPASDTIQMTNGFVLAPHPTDPSLLYFPLAGTTLFLIDATGAIRQRSDLPHRDINAIVFSPATPRVMYFGLKLSDMS